MEKGKGVDVEKGAHMIPREVIAKGWLGTMVAMGDVWSRGDWGEKEELEIRIHAAWNWLVIVIRFLNVG